MRYRTTVTAMIASVFLLALSCGSNESGSITVAFSDKARAEVPSASTDDIEELVAGNTMFALDLYEQLAAQDGNLFVSPYSVSAALGMTYPGAGGETAEEMRETLQFTLAPEQLHAAFGALEHLLSNSGETRDESEKFTLEIANSLWGQQGLNFEQSFLDTLAENYGAGMRLVDFINDHELARIAINRWVEKNTNDRIKELLEPGVVDPNTLLVLVNAIFFKANWQKPFDPGQDLEFQIPDGTTRTTPSMSVNSQFGFTQGDNFQAVKIPYEGAGDGRLQTSEFSMVVLLPEAGDFEEFESSLSIENLIGIRAGLDRQEAVKIRLPKFQIESKFSLPETLKVLGMKKAFDSGEADFSGLHKPSSSVFIGDVIHQAFVSVDEEGTEAAAATGVVSKFVGLAENDFEFTADRPFIFFIQDEQSDSILFMGRVLNPCAAVGVCSNGDVPSVSPMEIATGPGARLRQVGPVAGYTDFIDGKSDSTVYALSFDVGLRDRFRPIDLTPPYICAVASAELTGEHCLSPRIVPEAGSSTLITFSDSHQFAPNVPWTVEFHAGASDDYVLEEEERATITVWLLKPELMGPEAVIPLSVIGWDPDANGAHGILAGVGSPLSVNDQFTIEIHPLDTRGLTITRTLPRRFKHIIDLR